MNRLKDQVVIVTGGGKGMGATTARMFVAEGAHVVIADVAVTEGTTVATELGDAAMFCKLDVTRDADWQALVADTMARWGRIDALINNAGVLHFADIDGHSSEAFDLVMAVNVKGVFLGVKYVGQVMKAAGRGSIVNISSIDGLRGGSGVIAYSASKWALRGLTRTAALELGPWGVRVNGLHPGGIDTEMGNPFRLTGEARNRGYEVVPLQRIGEPQEVAALSLFLCTAEASYVSGAEIAVDGGWSAGHYHAGLPGAPASLGGAH